jgi:type IV pilus assembly protein PilC
MAQNKHKKQWGFLQWQFPGPVTQRDISSFCRGFSILIQSGIPVLKSLKTLAARTSHPKLQKALGEISRFVENGGTVSRALENYPRYFNPLIVSMVRVGESSGTLDEALYRIADLMEKRVALRQKLKSAFAYPVVSLLVAIGVIVFLLMRVIPVFIPLFRSSERHVQVPVPTQIIITLSEFLQMRWPLILTGVVFLGVILWVLVHTEHGKYVYDRYKLKFPVLGVLYTKVVVARFTRTMSVLLHSGVPLLEALQLSKPVTGSVNMAVTIQNAYDNLVKGGTFEEVLRESEVIPPLAVDIIAVGEQAGTLEEVLDRIANVYEEEIDVTIKGITSVIEPILVLIVGSVVLFIALSVFLPYFALVRIL